MEKISTEQLQQDMETRHKNMMEERAREIQVREQKDRESLRQRQLEDEKEQEKDKNWRSLGIPSGK